jgi:ABC-2 type transport system ATP-binding protein
MIRVDNLSKRYGDVQAVDRVSFEVRQGEIYGLLGPNGAGKTTTLSMISGILPPDDGRVLFEDTDMAVDPLGVKQQLGVVPQEVALYDELTPRENLRFWGGLYGLGGRQLGQRVESVLDQVGLSPKADKRVSTLSGGQQRRLNLGLGLVHEPRVIMMDEPTVGIDPQARANILDVVRAIASSGATILYTTHYLEEAEALCDRIGIMDHGRILAEGTLDELTRQLGDGEIVTAQGSFDVDRAADQLGRMEQVRVISVEPERLVLSAADGGGAVRLLSKLLDGELPIEGVSIQPPSLNGLFLKLTGRELRD